MRDKEETRRGESVETEGNERDRERGKGERVTRARQSWTAKTK